MHAKYEGFRKQAGQNQTELAVIAQQEAQEMGQINDRMVQQSLDSFDKLMRTQLKSMNQEADHRKVFREKLQVEEDEHQDKELSEITAFYQQLLTEAMMLGEGTVDIYVKMYNDIRDLQMARANEEITAEVEKQKAAGGKEKAGRRSGAGG